jgi:hypothetical protein
MRWICRYLGEVVLHECGVPERTVPRDANLASHLSAPTLEVDSVLELLRGKDKDHMLAVIVV